MNTMQNEMTESQQRVLVRTFRTIVEARSIGHDGNKNCEYQAGYYVGFLMGLTHIPEVQQALQREVDRWWWQQELANNKTVDA